MVNISIVLFKHPWSEIKPLVDTCLRSDYVNKIYLVDNSPSRMAMEALSPRVVYTFTGKNLGYGAGHNIAIRESIKDDIRYHLVLNPDIEMEPDILGKIIGYLDKHPDTAQVLPKVFYPNGEVQYLCKLLPTPMDLIFRRFIPGRFTAKRMEKFQLKFTGYNKIMNVPYLSGCFMFLRVASLKECGIFDERFFMYPEDIDLTRRLNKRYKTIFYPDVKVIHHHAAESYKSKKLLWIHITNMIKYFNKWGWIDADRNRINREILKQFN
ncbi:glycosyltransferase family 2 protein [Chitinophaga sp. CB10]|uniref:glycosyltransferase family 2 protein n=1 Tax=Chitinophaga sp. CB10 TaxID=1891659 RepID=UPI000A74E013|nr:glycosyltransferase family 2 protein [Chitinophaga sp. CB10]